VRAHPDMDYGKLFWSILVPWHNEWLAILLYLGFGLYFLIETFFIIFKHSSYKLKYHNDYEFMFVATLGIAASLLTTAFYLILYSKSVAVNKFMDGLNYMGILVMLYFYTFAFVGSQLLGSDAYFAFLSLLVLVLAVNIALIQHDIGRVITFYVSLALLLLIYLYDFFFHSSPK
jgi:hypothetical protein